MTTITVAINQTIVGKPDNMNWNAFQQTFKNWHLTTDQFFRAVAQHGHPFTAAHAGWRRTSNFIAGQHIALDFDSGIITFQEATANTLYTQFGLFAYTTPNHTDQEHRFRIVFALPEPTTDPYHFNSAWNAVMHHFEHIDEVNKDACARFFFGNPNPALTHINGKFLTNAVLRDQLIPSYKAHLEQTMAANETIKVKPDNDIDPKRAQGLLESFCDRIATAPEGAKHHTLRDVSRAAGGYVATGLFSKQDAITALYQSIAARPTVKNLNAAKKTIEQGIQFGMKDKLYLIDRHTQNIIDRITAVEPQFATFAANTQDIIADEIARYGNAVITEALQIAFDLTQDLATRHNITTKDQESILIPLYPGPNANPINLEMRNFDLEIHYQTDQPAATIYNFDSNDIIIVPDTLSAFALEDTTTAGIIGLGQTGIPSALSYELQNKHATLLTWDDANITEETKQLLKLAGARAAALPMSPRDMMAMGFTTADIKPYIRQSLPL